MNKEEKKTNPIKVSIVVPIYNVEPYVEQCLNSIINQTLKEIEIICVDDCGTDNSMQIVEEIAKKDKRIKIIHNEFNKGLGATRNIGFSFATGEYFGCVDSDDYIELTMFEKMYNEAKKFNSDLCFCDVYRLNDTTFVKNNELKNKLSELENKRFLFEDLGGLAFKLYFSAWSRIYKRKFFNSNIRYIEGRKYEDMIPFFIGIIKSNNITCVNEQLYFYRINRKNSISNQKINVEDIIFELEGVFQLFKNNSLYKKYKYDLLSLCYKAMSWFPLNKSFYYSIKQFLIDNNFTLNDIQYIDDFQYEIKNMLKYDFKTFMFIQRFNKSNFKKFLNIFYKKKKSYIRILFIKINNNKGKNEKKL